MTIYNKFDDRQHDETFTGATETKNGIEYLVTESEFLFPASEWSATPTETSPKR
jgi:hypothetical protein